MCICGTMYHCIVCNSVHWYKMDKQILGETVSVYCWVGDVTGQPGMDERWNEINPVLACDWWYITGIAQGQNIVKAIGACRLTSLPHTQTLFMCMRQVWHERHQWIWKLLTVLRYEDHTCLGSTNFEYLYACRQHYVSHRMCRKSDDHRYWKPHSKEVLRTKHIWGEKITVMW